MSTPGTGQPSAPPSNLNCAGRALTWLLWGVFWLAFYVLSPGPLLWLVAHGHIPAEHQETYLAALEFIYAPLEIIIAQTPLATVLWKYTAWWTRL